MANNSPGFVKDWTMCIPEVQKKRKSRADFIQYYAPPKRSNFTEEHTEESQSPPISASNQIQSTMCNGMEPYFQNLIQKERRDVIDQKFIDNRDDLERKIQELEAENARLKNELEKRTYQTSTEYSINNINSSEISRSIVLPNMPSMEKLFRNLIDVKEQVEVALNGMELYIKNFKEIREMEFS